MPRLDDIILISVLFMDFLRSGVNIYFLEKSEQNENQTWIRVFLPF